jgi:hypothetical protein
MSTKDFKCDTCKKQSDVMWQFTQYGGQQRFELYREQKKFCEECFVKKEKEINEKQ